MRESFDTIIIGGGIVGASTALQLKKRYPKQSILLLEKENGPACHQTGHNSGVIHAGVYYPPGSLKADFCKRGLSATIEFCEKHDIPYESCGKLIVATNEDEIPRLTKLFNNSRQNGLTVEWLEQQELHEREPNISGIKGFFVKDSAITDYVAITAAMLKEFQALGGEVQFNSKVTALAETTNEVSVTTEENQYKSNFLICCAGLQADRIAQMIGLEVDFRIVPFRGEYFQLPAAHNNIVKHLIYPVPDPDMPFLGVHLTRMIDGSVTVGPNAVLGLSREGYNKLSVSLLDITNMASFKGFWKVIFGNLRSGVSEMKNSLWKRGYLRLVQRYCPMIKLNELRPYPAGIRAQAVMNNGDLVQDFLFMDTPRSLHVCNAPSPAATSALPIGEYICRKVSSRITKIQASATSAIE